jgi:phage terminase large subunit GpA-like protein
MKSKAKTYLQMTGALMKVLAPPPNLTVSQWADKYRKLSPEASAEPGSWKTSRAAYQQGMMDAVNEAGVSEVVFMTSSQIGKTEILNNILAYFAH